MKISDLKLSNYRETTILIEYYFIKSNLNNDEKYIYINKLTEVYEELLRKGNYNFIVTSKKIFATILTNLNDLCETF